MDPKHIDLADINIYSYCPQYYKYYLYGNYRTLNMMQQNSFRYLFNWVMLNYTNGISPTLEALENKASELEHRYNGDAHTIFEITKLLETHVGKYKVVSAGLEYPITVAQTSVLITIDAIIDSMNSPYTWFVILDFNPGSYSIDMLKYSPKHIITAHAINEDSLIPKQQSKYLIIRVAKLQAVELSLTISKEITTLEPVITNINRRVFYRRISNDCSTCSFRSNCMG